ncbi:MAG: RNA methyltransferase [Bacteroidia bacterium]|nr:RNA methyltransferase [Bacteroidia bacterium]
MLTKATVKWVKSLSEKSNRIANKLFVAEGSKSVLDLLEAKVVVTHIFALDNWLIDNNANIPKSAVISSISPKEMSQLSGLKSPREVLALFSIPLIRFEPNAFSGLILALDTIQDPGNLGTIIRLADWYGIKHILCSENTVDAFNSKVVQATMGSLGRVQLHYGDLSVFFSQISLPVLAAEMNGIEARKVTFSKDMILLLGNEGSGVSPHLKPHIHQSISIERIGSAESLNVAMASAILIDRYFGQFSM